MTDERRRDQSAGDAAVDAAWRSASREVPAARVDAAILAAAQAEARRQAVGRRAPERPAWWRAWQPLAAAAGVAGLAFVLVQQIPREPDVRAPRLESAPQIDSAAPAASAPQYDSTAPAASAPPVESPAPLERVLQTDRAAAQQAPAATVATGVLADAAAEAEADSTVASVAAPAPAPAPAAGDAPDPRQESASAERSALARAAAAAAKQSAAAEPGPEEWARHIAALHDAGDVVAAATELRAFRQAHADADDHLTPALRAWAASVDAAEAP
jgi:hypothetical protein